MLSSPLTATVSSTAAITRAATQTILHPDLSLPRDSQNTFLHTFQTPRFLFSHIGRRTSHSSLSLVTCHTSLLFLTCRLRKRNPDPALQR
jgi:hypothetical protein